KPAGDALRVWDVTPARDLNGGETYELVLSQGLKTPLGPLAGAHAKTVGTATTFGNFAVEGITCLDANDDRQTISVNGEADDFARCRPEGVQLQFSARVPRETLEMLAWEPELDAAETAGQAWDNYARWRFTPGLSAAAGKHTAEYPLPFDLKPMTDYTVTLPAGLKDTFGRTLDDSVEISFRTGHRTPALSWIPDHGVLEAAEQTIIPLTFTNLDRMYFGYWTLVADDLFTGPGDGGEPTFFDELSRDDLDIEQDTITRTEVGVRDWLDGRSGVVWGYYDWTPNGPKAPCDCMAQCTPYQVWAKIGHYDSLVWVSRLDDGEPVANAHVRIVHGHKQDLSHFNRDGDMAITDAHGLAQLPGTVVLGDAWFRKWKHDNRFYVGVVDDARTDMALLPMQWSFDRSILTASDYTVWPDEEAEYGHMRVWAITSQGLYRPGSSVPYTVFVRAVGSKTLTPAPDLDYTLSITDPKGNEIVDKEHVKLSEYGDFQGQVDIPESAPMGTYVIHLSWPV